MNRIEKRMEELQQKNEKAFVTYMTAGLPDMEGTRQELILSSLEYRFQIQQQMVRLFRMHPIVPSVKEQM